MKIETRIGCAVGVAIGLTIIGTGLAFGMAPSDQQGLNNVVIVDDTSYLDANTLLMFVKNTGVLANASSGMYLAPGLYFPRLSSKTLMYAAGLWIGAKVDGEVSVTRASYSEEYTPGPMLGGTFQPDNPAFHVYKIRRGDSRASNPDFDQWPFDQGAPAVKNHLGIDSLDPGGFKIPLLLGEQALWTVFNDADPSRHIQNAGGGLPLGVEVQLYAYANNTSCGVGQTISLQYRIINKGGNTLDSAYLSLWADPDIGMPQNDLVGCDTSLSLGYCFDLGPDEIYGNKPPSVGITVLQGPIVPSVSGSAWDFRQRIWIPRHQQLPMTAFTEYLIGSDPYEDLESYNLMRGLDQQGAQIVDPSTGQSTRFMYSGDPVAGSGWLDQGSGDRRFVISSGPLTMNPGDTQEVVAALIVAAGEADTLYHKGTILAAHTSGNSDGSGNAFITSPLSVTGHDYQVSFQPDPDSFYVWSLKDLVTNMLVTSGRGQSFYFPTVDGMLVRVYAPLKGIRDCGVANGLPRLTWVGANGLQLESFNGAIEWADPGGTLGGRNLINRYRLRNVLLKFAATDSSGLSDSLDPNVSYAYRYLQSPGPPARPEFAPFIVNSSHPDYRYQDFSRSVPLSAWDVESVPPRRLAIAFCENNAIHGSVDGKWWPPNGHDVDNVASDGPREWLWVLNVDYSTMPNHEILKWNSIYYTGIPAMYFLTVARDGNVSFAAGDEFMIFRSNPNTDADTFYIPPAPPPRDTVRVCDPIDATSAVGELKRIVGIVGNEFTQAACDCPHFADPIQDGEFSVLDVLAIIDQALGGAPVDQESSCPIDRCDFNADGATDMPDVVAAINYAFKNGAAPRNPCL